MHVCQACFSAFSAMPTQYSSTQNTEKRQLCPFQAGDAFVKGEKRNPQFSFAFRALHGREKCQTNFPARCEKFLRNQFPPLLPIQNKRPGKSFQKRRPFSSSSSAVRSMYVPKRQKIPCSSEMEIAKFQTVLWGGEGGGKLFPFFLKRLLKRRFRPFVPLHS